MVFDDVSCNDFLTFDGEVAVTQDTLTREMIVEEMRVDESRYKKRGRGKGRRTRSGRVAYGETECITNT